MDFSYSYGASDDSIVWRPFKYISYPMLRKHFQATLMDLLRQKCDGRMEPTYYVNHEGLNYDFIMV